MSKPTVIENPGGVIGNLVFEQIESGETSQYAVYKDGSWTTKGMLTFGNVNYTPIVPPPWTVPGKPLNYESEETLFNEVRKFSYDHIDFPFDEIYDVYTAWVLADWRSEQWDSAAYLNFLGAANSGKTRSLDVLNNLCYRPIASANISTAALFRCIEAWHPTLLIDEAQTLKQKDKADIIAILNSGQRRGMKAIRVEKIREGQLTLKAFDTFCFKALAGTEGLTRTLTSRCIIFNMIRTVRPVSRFVDKTRAEELRSKLLMYRFRKLSEAVSAGNPLDLPDGRLVELYLPLIEVAPTPKEKKTIENWAKKSYKRILKEEKTQAEARIFEVIVELIPDQGMTIPIAAITEKLNIGVPEENQWKSNTVSRIIGDKLAFDRDRILIGQKKTSCVLIDENILERLKKRYMFEKLDGYLETPGVDELERNMCEKCGKELGKLRLIKGKERWLCDSCDVEEMIE